MLRLQCLSQNPKDRPSVNRILSTPFVQKRIEKFLGATLLNNEFR